MFFILLYTVMQILIVQYIFIVSAGCICDVRSADLVRWRISCFAMQSDCRHVSRQFVIPLHHHLCVCGRHGTMLLASFVSQKQEAEYPTCMDRAFHLGAAISTLSQVQSSCLLMNPSWHAMTRIMGLLNTANKDPHSTNALMGKNCNTPKPWIISATTGGGGVAVTNGASHDGLLAAAIGAGMWWRGPPIPVH